MPSQLLLLSERREGESVRILKGPYAQCNVIIIRENTGTAGQRSFSSSILLPAVAGQMPLTSRQQRSLYREESFLLRREPSGLGGRHSNSTWQASLKDWNLPFVPRWLPNTLNKLPVCSSSLLLFQHEGVRFITRPAIARGVTWCLGLLHYLPGLCTEKIKRSTVAFHGRSFNPCSSAAFIDREEC